MSKLRKLFGGKQVEVENKPDIELDNELYLTIARYFGRENSTITNLLIDAEQKIKELDGIKHAISEQIDPVSKTYRVFEETKSKLGTAENRITMLESEGARLRETLTAAQQKLAVLESTNAAQVKELTSCRTQIAELKTRGQKQGADIQTGQEENRRLNDRVAVAERQKSQLENELSATRQKLESTQQKLTATENERAGLQKSLEKATAELSQMARSLAAAEKSIEDAREKYESDIALHEANYEALKTRAELTHKLLEETRNGMLERAKEIGSSIAA